MPLPTEPPPSPQVPRIYVTDRLVLLSRPALGWVPAPVSLRGRSSTRPVASAHTHRLIKQVHAPALP